MNKMESESMIRNLIAAKNELIEDGTARDLGYESSARESIKALRFALFAIMHPNELCCGRCEYFGDESSSGDGWCYKKDVAEECDKNACGSYERKAVFE